MQEVGDGKSTAIRGGRFCVYTTLIGGYERLNEQTIVARSDIPFICLTDDEGLTSKSWTIRQVTPVFPQDAIRSQRDLKLRPHYHLPDFDRSLYIDNSVMLSATPEEIVARHGFGRSGIAVPPHSYRERVIDEFLEVSRLGYDDQSRIFEQLNHYLLSHEEIMSRRPYWTAILLRDHLHPAVVKLGETWAAHVQRYSRRDQLSFNVACRMAGATPDAIDIDNHASWFHRWPVAVERERSAGTRALAVSIAPPAALLRGVELELEQEKASHGRTIEALNQANIDLSEVVARTRTHDLAILILRRLAAKLGFRRRLSVQ